MSEQKPEVRIQVAKADLSLGTNESVEQFLGSLMKAMRPHLETKLKIKFESTPNKSAYVYPVDVFADAAIVEVSQYPEGKTSKRGFYQVAFKRADMGRGFEFGDPVEVVKQIQYVPKTPVQKSAGSVWADVL